MRSFEYPRSRLFAYLHHSSNRHGCYLAVDWQLQRCSLVDTQEHPGINNSKHTPLFPPRPCRPRHCSQQSSSSILSLTLLTLEKIQHSASCVLGHSRSLEKPILEQHDSHTSYRAGASISGTFCVLSGHPI